MKTSELKQLLVTGPLAIEFGVEAEVLEGYVERGMRATLIGVTLESDDVTKITVDYTAFEEHNIPLEQANYYDRRGYPILTARQAKQYSVKEDYFLSSTESIDSILTLLGEAESELIREFRNSGAKSYVCWLEEQLIAQRRKS
jgi:hypothetical protein